MHLSNAFKSGFVSGFTCMFTFLSGVRPHLDSSCISANKNEGDDDGDGKDAWEKAGNDMEEVWRQVGEDLNSAIRYEELNQRKQGK